MIPSAGPMSCRAAVQAFNLQTGGCFEDENVKIGAYDIRVDSGRVAVRIEG